MAGLKPLQFVGVASHEPIVVSPKGVIYSCLGLLWVGSFGDFTTPTLLSIGMDAFVITLSNVVRFNNQNRVEAKITVCC